ncbi:uncharacterized protein LOC132557189 [Ylistrum balloti]|uniref:uncharacterized protein LOC132557189 n=1 Tax=Ylistrum balloti TaxID=509963 RepID=UPI00290583A1|nr:uncharacterized protein LOC132557189 [Ylistrum balloti]
MKMGGKYLLLLFMSFISTSSSQEGTCTPQEVPESVIDCTTFDSIFLTCVCNAYKTSILDIMKSLSCLLPGGQFGMTSTPDNPFSSKMTAVSSASPVSPASPISPFSPGATVSPLSSATTTSMYKALYTTIVTRTSYQQSRERLLLQTSVFNEEWSDLVRNITTQIGENVFDKFCEGVPEIQQCVGPDSMRPVDLMLKTFVNLDNLQQSMTSICELKADIFNNVDCLINAAVPMTACVLMSYTGPTFQQSRPEMMFGDLETYCPIAGDVSRCMAIQIKSCSPQLGTTIRKVESDLLSSDCAKLAAAGTNNPVMAVPLLCALQTLPSSIRVIREFATDATVPSSADIQTLISNMIDVYCGELSDLLTCVYQELPSSMNSIDKFIQALVDVNQFSYADTISQYICQPSRIQDIKEMIPCLIPKGENITSCFAALAAVGFNLSSIGVDAAKDRMTYCGPVKNVTFCTSGSVLSPCNTDVATFFEDLFLTLMRTDCNGVRNGPLQNLISDINASTTLTNKGLPPIFGLLVIMAFLLL